LGLDIGANSVGWAAVTLDGDGRPVGLGGTGVRVFPEGVEGDLTTGREKSRAVKRREARLRRRMLERQTRRLVKVALVLQGAGLLPAGKARSAADRMSFFAALDESLFPEQARKTAPHVLPYALRARALDERLERYELGRALYHLAQRRGFLSNRRESAGARGDDQKKEEGKVKKGIGELRERMEKSGARTLGEYFAGLDPTQERIRQRYTARGMYEEEFEAIWAAQAAHHPAMLTEELKKRLHRAIFFQRPLKSQAHLIGECDLERGRRRAPWALLSAQRFRYLQKVNDLDVTEPTGERRRLTDEERNKLAEALESKPNLTWAGVRRALGLARGCHFNYEEGGEKGLLGNKTAARLAGVFGRERWAGMSREEQDRVVEDLHSIHDRKALARRGMRAWGLDEEAAGEFAGIPLEDGHCSLSRQALERVVPLLEEGVQYATARKQLYGEKPGPRAVDALPPLDDVLEVRNPAVERALTEVRKVVNAIVREHGRPHRIRIELARDLRRTRPQREKTARQQRRNRAAREAAAGKLLHDMGMASPKRDDTEKVLLAEESGWQCPYTGKTITMQALFGEAPQFDVEHIVPFHRCLDNSFVNKTLCEADENRSRKRGRTPWEAYGSDAERWEEIIARVRGFKSNVARAKLEKFLQQEMEGLDEFAARQLNDTRYASRLAVEFVGHLYGARADGVDPHGKQRVEASRGQVTWFLRSEWRLNQILGGGPEKERADHRQHGIDAVVVALTEPRTVKMLSQAAVRAAQAGRRRFAPVEPPWPGFLDEVREAVLGMLVSHRAQRKVSGPMHEETIYSKLHPDREGREWAHVRKRLGSDRQALSQAEVGDIVDPVIRRLVEEKLRELGVGDPKKAFASEENHPEMVTRDGRRIPIHSVRIRSSVGTETIGKGPRERRVKLGSNHHVEILEVKDKRGRVKWEGVVVSMYKAMRRLRAAEPVVQREHGHGKEFKFSLAGGEIIELDAEEDKMDKAGRGKTAAAGLYVVRTVTLTGGYPRVDFAAANDARLKKDMLAAGDWGWASMSRLQKRNCRKVSVTPLGEVRRAGD